MEEGHEFESIIALEGQMSLDIKEELKRAIREISEIRNRPVICYLANVINNNIRSATGIDTTDDLPFSEMLDRIDSTNKAVDIILVTPGGNAEQVARFVHKLRPRFENVGFILPFMAMSAGTIFCLSGDEIIMDSRAFIGPIDPQVPSKGGGFVPAQALTVLIDDINKRGQEKLNQGQQPDWTDVQIINRIDAKELGNAISASNFSIELVTNYLANYKFKTWNIHERTQGQPPVTDEDKQERAKEIAEKLCKHAIWKTHSRGITREMAYSVCDLKIIFPEDTPNLQKAIRRFWALAYWAFDRTSVYKIFLSENYSLFRSEMKGVLNNGRNDK